MGHGCAHQRQGYPGNGLEEVLLPVGAGGEALLAHRSDGAVYIGTTAAQRWCRRDDNVNQQFLEVVVVR